MRGVLAALCCVLVLAACSTTLPPPLPAAEHGPYRLDSGDKVRVIVYGEQTLSTEYTVGSNGTIAFPMIGSIKARSLTVQALQAEITRGLKGVLVKPSVSVEVSEYRPVFILGEVGKPGQYPYKTGLNVLTAVAMAGGFSVRADERRMTVVRKSAGKATEWHADRLADLQPGDLVVVPERFF
jgi:polysaccharide export outer membrane protein